MKKYIYFIASLTLLTTVALAQNSPYYVKYPIVANQTTNGSQFRLELSVYDSALATTQTYNTAYFDQILGSGSSNGIVTYSAWPIDFVDKQMAVITYDFEVHQWKPYILYDNSYGNCSAWSYLNGSVELWWENEGSSFGPEHAYVGFYDIVSHSWNITGITGNQGNAGASSNQSKYMYWGWDGDPFASHILGTFNFKNHAIAPLLFGSGTAYGQYQFTYNGSTIGYYYYDDQFDPNNDNAFMGTFDPLLGYVGLSSSSGELSNVDGSWGIYTMQYDITQTLDIAKYDAQQQQLKTITYPSTAIGGFVKGQNVIALRNSANTMVISAVYDFNLHQWKIDSVPTPSVTGLAINNGTVSWNNGSGTVTRGYNSTNGWGNYNTTLQAVFYLSNLTSATAGNLIFVRDYSIGATGWSYNYGDGFTETSQNGLHLYKIGGSYLYSGSSPNYNVCLTATNSGGSTSTCINISCPVSASITAAGSTTFCTGGSVTLNETTGATGVSYQWKLNGNNINAATTSSYIATAAGNYTCEVIATCGSATSNTIAVTVGTVPPQPNSIIGITQSCNPQNNVIFSIPPVAGATSYNWYSTNPAVTINPPNGGTSISVNLGTTTTSTWSLRVEPINACGAGPFRSTSVSRIVSGVTTITGTNVICTATNGVVYNCNTVGGADSYFWTVPSGATFVSGQGTTAITVNFSNGFNGGNICVSSQLNCGFNSVPKCFTVAKGGSVVPGNISGNTTVCPGGQGNFSIVSISGVTYNWTVPAGASIISGAGTNAITVLFPSTYTTGNVCVNVTNACGVTSITKCRTVVNGAPSRPASIAGIVTGVCNSTQSYTSSIAIGATSYLWSVTGGTIQSGQGTQTVAILWSSTVKTGTIKVNGVNACGNGLVRSVAVSLKPSSTANISGNISPCSNTSEIYNFTPLFGVTNYLWNVNNSSGASVTNGQGTTTATIQWAANGGTVYCTPSNTCGSSSTKTLAINITCREAGEELSNDKNSLINVEVAPNPFSTELIITSDVYGNGVVIILSDMLGKTISQQILSTSKFELNTSSLSGGVYFLAVSNYYEKKVFKVVK